MSYPNPPSPTPAGGGFGASVPPPPPGAQIPLPPPAPPRRDRKGTGRGLAVAGVIAACVAVLVAGVVGVFVGNLTATKDQPVQAAPASPTSAPTPTTEQVRAATVDLCTRFAAGYRARGPRREASDAHVLRAGAITVPIPVSDEHGYVTLSGSLATIRKEAVSSSNCSHGRNHAMAR